MYKVSVKQMYYLVSIKIFKTFLHTCTSNSRLTFDLKNTNFFKFSRKKIDVLSILQYAELILNDSH